jgi:hypothetical protein
MLRFLHAVITNSPLGTVRATTAKPYFVEGEKVEGTVHCEFIAPVAAKSITVVLEGYEKVEWHERDDRSESIPGSDPPQSRTIPRYIRRRAKKTFFKQQIPVSFFWNNTQGKHIRVSTFALDSTEPWADMYIHCCCVLWVCLYAVLGTFNCRKWNDAWYL